MDSIAPLDSAFMSMRCVHCGYERRMHMQVTVTMPLGDVRLVSSCDFEPVDLPRRDAVPHVPVKREGRVL
jgi:hypothetical protein